MGVTRRTSEIPPEPGRARYRIGRGPDNELILNEPSVSRRHAELYQEDGEWLVSDLGSRHGTRVNGRPIGGPVRLLPGDEVSCGEVVVVFDSPPGSDVGERETEPVVTRDYGQALRLVGDSAGMRRCRDLIRRFAGSTATVLITGESGTGKEVAARLLHEQSPRQAQPFVVINCPALPGTLLDSELFGVEKRVATEVDAREGKLEQADGGTLFLDEVGDIDVAAQAKLLRFLQDKTVERVGGRKQRTLDVRIVAATNQDLVQAIDLGRFRLDLYHRINTLSLQLPPLRDRREDIPALVEHFLRQTERPKLEITAAALARLAGYLFPGNVRELQRVIEQASLLVEGDRIDVDDLGALAGPGAISESDDDRARELHRRLVDDGADFWHLVREPYLCRELSREVVRRTISLGFEDAGRSLRELGRLYGIDDAREYKKLRDFLRNHDLV